MTGHESTPSSANEVNEIEVSAADDAAAALFDSIRGYQTEHPDADLSAVFGNQNAPMEGLARLEVLQSILDGATTAQRIQQMSSMGDKTRVSQTLSHLSKAGVISVTRTDKIAIDPGVATNPTGITKSTSELRQDIIAVTQQMAAEGKTSTSSEELAQKVAEAHPDKYEDKRAEIQKTISTKVQALAWNGLMREPGGNRQTITINSGYKDSVKGVVDKLMETPPSAPDLPKLPLAKLGGSAVATTVESPQKSHVEIVRESLAKIEGELTGEEGTLVKIQEARALLEEAAVILRQYNIPSHPIQPLDELESNVSRLLGIVNNYQENL